MAQKYKLYLLLLGLVGLAIVPYVMPGYKTSIATEVLIFAVLAMSVDILAGYTGRTPLCHGAIFGVATYVVVYYVTVYGGSVWVGSILGILAATATAVVFALLAMDLGYGWRERSSRHGSSRLAC